MGLIDPTRGELGSGVWHDAIDANTGRIDAHDHTSGKGARVPTAGININADLSFGGLYAPISLHRLTFASITSLSSNNKSLFVDSDDNELYWRTGSGTNVKLTDGTALNVAAFTGGFGSDYATNGNADYDAAGVVYTFKESGGTWARVASSAIRLYEHGTSEALYVAHVAPSALASSYTVTWPDALPAGDSVLRVSSAGAISTSLVEAHAQRKIQVSGAAFQVAAVASAFPAGTVPEYDGTSWLFTPSASVVLYASVPLPVGTRIKTIKWFFDKNSNSSSLTMRLRKIAADGTITNISTTSDTSSGASPTSSTTATIDYTIEDDYQVQLSVSAGVTAHAFQFAIITYDRVS
jgi:hypothetical protein